MKKLVKGFASVILASMFVFIGCNQTTGGSKPTGGVSKSPGGGSEPTGQKKITVTVAYDANVEKVEPATLSVTKGSTWSAIKSQIRVTPKTGFVHAGWKLDNASGENLTDDKKFEKDTTVFAVSQEAVTVTVHGDEHVAEIKPKTLSVAKGSKWSTVEPLITVTYEDGYGKAGWKLNDASGEDLTDGSTLDSDRTVFACSEKLLTITVAHDDNVVKVDPETLFVKKGSPWSSVKSRIKVTYKDGFVEAGWKLNDASGADLTDDYPFNSDTTVYLCSKNTVTVRVRGDERIDLEQQIEKPYNTKWSDIKAEIKGNIKPSAGWKDDWDNGDYAVYEWRLNDENGEKIGEDYRFTDNTTVYAVSNYKKWKIEDDGSGNKVLSGVEDSNKPRGKIIIPDDVTSIGDRAFYDCSELASIALPKNLASIGDYAFFRCSELASIALPEGLTSIGENAFRDCTSLANITIPEGVTSIRDGAFYGCYKLESITIPKGITSIENSTFSGCSSLKSITLPEGVKSIGEATFYFCHNLKSITIPASVTSIGERAFYECDKLESITIPANVTLIERGTFYGCSNLASIALPNGVKSIGDSAFRDCTSLANITLPKDLTSIEPYAFNGCNSLKSITIPKGVTSINRSTFQKCNNLTLLRVDSGNTVYKSDNNIIYTKDGKSLIAVANGLTGTIDILDSVTSIGGYAFNYCSKIASITIPASVTSIGWDVFKECDSLETVHFDDKKGWAVYFDSKCTEKVTDIKESDLTDTNAKELLTATYDTNYWKKN